MQDKLIHWLNQPFTLLDKTRHRWLLILSTGIFAMVFMNVYTPFNMDTWIQISGVPLFLILSSYGILGMVTFILSQIVVRNLFHISSYTRFTYALWFFAELLLLSLIMFLVYGDHSQESNWNLLSEYFLSFRYTILVLIIPYAMVLFYFQNLKEKNARSNYVVPGDHLVKIKDENDIMQLAIDLNQLLFIQSTDNYVSVFFLKDNKVKKELVRTSLKKLESELKGSPLVRCHRSYMVNLKKILVTKKTSKGMMLELKDYHDEQIMVSKHYRSKILQLLQQD